MSEDSKNKKSFWAKVALLISVIASLIAIIDYYGKQSLKPTEKALYGGWEYHLTMPTNILSETVDGHISYYRNKSFTDTMKLKSWVENDLIILVKGSWNLQKNTITKNYHGYEILKGRQFHEAVKMLENTFFLSKKTRIEKIINEKIEDNYFTISRPEHPNEIDFYKMIR